MVYPAEPDGGKVIKNSFSSDDRALRYICEMFWLNYYGSY